MYCHPFWKTVYLGLVTTTGFAGSIVSLYPMFQVTISVFSYFTTVLFLKPSSLGSEISAPPSDVVCRDDSDTHPCMASSRLLHKIDGPFPARSIAALWHGIYPILA